MTVKSDLEKLLASCEEIRGSYAKMGQSTENPQAKEMFTDMKMEIDKHIEFLKDRLEYLTVSNQLNQSRQ